MSTNPGQERLTREEVAHREIGQTEISRGLAWVMNIAFLLTILVPPTWQLIHELCDKSTPGQPLSAIGPFSKSAAVIEPLFRPTGGIWNRVVAANERLLQNIVDYESQLEERSLLTRNLIGPTQHCLTEFAGLGNENAYVGRYGQLFYRPDVDYLTGPGFLEPHVLRRRAVSGKQQPVQPDPRRAILEFHRQLLQRGIKLVIVPLPGKAAIHPMQLSSRFSNIDEPLENPSFQQFVQEMNTAGVLVFDPAPFLTRSKFASALAMGHYLRTDTHWTPEAMDDTARRLGNFIQQQCSLTQQSSTHYHERTREVTNLGDIAVMLRLPADQTLYRPEAVRIREVSLSTGEAWKPDEAADVLLLGDSFTNIYSLAELNWGTGAGLAERLSFALQRPVDRIAQNSGGSHAVRQALAAQLAQGHDRLKGKRVVIWEFAARELAFGDWKLLPLPDLPAAKAVEPVSPDSSEGQLVRGRVVANAGAPQPGSVPYRDAVTGIHLDRLEGVSAPFPKSEIVVYLWGLRENKLTNAAQFAPDQVVSLKLVPWSDVREKYERFNRIELDDPEFRLAELPTYWAEEAP